MPPAADRRRPAGARWLLATGSVTAFWFCFFVANARTWSATRHPVGLGVVILELVFAVLFVLRRQPLTVSRAPLAWVAAAIGSFGMLAARPHYAPVGGHDLPFAVLQLGATAAAVFCLLSLGRSFGLVAANRGLRTRGPYGIVRHPVYACYLLVVSGYLLENPSPWNLFVAGAFTTAQLLRVREEERCLARDPGYRLYRSRVRYRLVPFVF
jgi:protein-S-isoprenylcysteine O-methyltransferase Ste14